MIPRIYSLLKEKKYQEAYTAGISLMSDPAVAATPAARLCMAECVFGMMKAESKAGEGKTFPALIESFLPLRLVELGDIRLHNKACWPVMTVMQHWQQNPEQQNPELAKSIFRSLTRLTYNKPHKYYSLLPDALLKVKTVKMPVVDWFDDFMEWWGYDSFLPEDYLPVPVQEGQVMRRSLVERVYTGVFKAINGKVRNYPKERLKTFIDRLDRLAQEHPEYHFTQYYKARLLLEAGRRDEAREALTPMLALKRSEFWVWDTLGDILEDPRQRLACYCRALSCRAADNFKTRLRLKAAELMCGLGMHDAARTELELYAEAQRNGGNHLSPRAQDMMKEDWYAAAARLADNRELYSRCHSATERMANEGIPQTDIIIKFVNREKRYCVFGTDKVEKAYFSYKKHPSLDPQPNTRARARFAAPPAETKWSDLIDLE